MLPGRRNWELPLWRDAPHEGASDGSRTPTGLTVCVCLLQPHRVRMTHELIQCFNLYQKMEVFVRGCGRHGLRVGA